MKLINRTKIPDEALRAVLTAAARSLHKRLRTQNVVVMVNYNTYDTGSSGMAYRAWKVRWGGKGWLTTDKGAFKINLPKSSLHPIAAAETFFNVARHEWGHIFDFQSGKTERSPHVGHRRIAHDKRIEERRVYDYIDQSKSKPDDYYESVMALALILEKR